MMLEHRDRAERRAAAAEPVEIGVSLHVPRAGIGGRCRRTHQRAHLHDVAGDHFGQVAALHPHPQPTREFVAVADPDAVEHEPPPIGQHVDAALVLTNLAKDEGLTVVHSAEADALIVYDGEDEDLIIADIIAPSIPELTAVLGMLGRRPTRVKILFPPDKLGWRGEAVAEDTGLMIRGTPPDAMTRPFMFPPTAEF